MAQIKPNGIIVGKGNVGHGAVVSKIAYEGTVIARAMERAGRNPHLKARLLSFLPRL